MLRLLLVLSSSALLLAAFDAALPGLLSIDAEARLEDRRNRAFTNITARHLDDLQRDASLRLEWAHDRWSALPQAKRDDELRVFLVGNSTAIFAVLPEGVREGIAEAFPKRSVSVTPLLIQGIRVAGEQVLVRAALARGADVIVILANLKGLLEGMMPLGGRMRALFLAHEREHGIDLGARMDVFLHDHWRLYRDRRVVRARIQELVRFRRDRSAAVRMGSALEQIADAAETGDLRQLLAVYTKHRMGALIGTPVFRRRLAEDSPVYSLMEDTARLVERSDTLGIAVFLPVNPLFRDAELNRDFPRLAIDDAYVRGQARRVLEIYQRHGFVVSDQVDALRASEFVDLVHINSRGMHRFSRVLADAIIQAVGEARAAENASRAR